MWLQMSCTELFRASFFSSEKEEGEEQSLSNILGVGVVGKWNSTGEGTSGTEFCFFLPIPVRCGDEFNPFFSQLKPIKKSKKE